MLCGLYSVWCEMTVAVSPIKGQGTVMTGTVLQVWVQSGMFSVWVSGIKVQGWLFGCLWFWTERKRGRTVRVSPSLT